MGVVYRAKDLKLDRMVALKFLPSNFCLDPERKQRFIQEAKAASALDHPGICNVHEIDEVNDGQLFICMAYYEGETLKERIERAPLTAEEAISITLQICEGLCKAHRHGIVHRDIKPANVILTEGMAKIVDFGLVKLTSQQGLTREGAAVGTAAYMSPEQAKGETVDGRTDIWSLGVVLYQMLTGRLPFEADYEQAMIYNILHEEIKAPSRIRPETPPDLERIVFRCLAKNPAERYSQMDELAKELSRLKGGLEEPGEATGKEGRRAASKARFYLLPALLGGGLLLARFLYFTLRSNFNAEAQPPAPVVVVLTSPEAHRHWVAGEELFRQKKFQEAIREYGQVLSFDPTFRLASVRIQEALLRLYGNDHPQKRPLP